MGAMASVSTTTIFVARTSPTTDPEFSTSIDTQLDFIDCMGIGKWNVVEKVRLEGACGTSLLCEDGSFPIIDALGGFGSANSSICVVYSSLDRICRSLATLTAVVNCVRLKRGALVTLFLEPQMLRALFELLERPESKGNFSVC